MTGTMTAAMRRSVLLLSSALLAAGCSLPRRDNPNDPENAVPNAIRVVSMSRFNCREWEGFVEGQAPYDDPGITNSEYQQIDTWCSARCPFDGSDPGGPDVFVWMPNSCQ